jgi:hypothetical protein
VAAWPRPAAGLLSSRLDTDADGAVWVAGGESEEVWRLDRAGHLDVFGAGLRVVALSARPRGKLFLLAQSPDRLLAADLPSAR